MKKSVFTCALSVVALVACSLCQPATTRAADVTLTSGSAVLNCTFQVSDPSLLFTTIEVTGQDFSLLFSSLPRPFPDCSPAGISLNPARFDAFAVVTFQGITTMGMSGNLTFDETSITGLVEGRDLFNPNVVLFTVNF